MTRRILVPKEAHEDLRIFFDLTKKEIDSIAAILNENDFTTAEQFCVEIINKVGKTDSESTSILKIISFLLSKIIQDNIELPQFIEEIIDSVEREGNQKLATEIKKALKNNLRNYKTLLMSHKEESKKLKELWLSKRVVDSVDDIKTICDIRPIFNEKRDLIDTYIAMCHFEITICDSLGNPKVIHLTFNQDSFTMLKEQVNKVEAKLKIVNEKIDQLKEH